MEQKNVIDLLIIIGSLGAMMYGMLKFFLREIHKDLEDIKKSIDKHESRIDHLYHITVELLKDKK